MRSIFFCHKKLFSAFTAVIILLLTAGCSRASRESVASTQSVRWQDYDGKRIGVITGTPLETVALEKFPKSKLFYYNSYPDMNIALLSGTIDAYVSDEPGMEMIHAEEPRIGYISEYFAFNDYAFAFRKNDDKRENLRKELNAFLAKIKADGTFKEIEEIWLGDDESRKTVDFASLTGENGTLSVATTSTDMPFSYIKDGKNAGYDIDLVARFCKEYGYKVQFVDVDFAARLPMVQSGRCDFSTDMNVTPERKEAVNFSDPTAQGGIVLAVPTDILTGEPARGGGGQSNQNETDLLLKKGVKILEQTLGDDVSIAFGFGKNPSIPNLKEKLNQFIKEIKADGTLDEIYDRYIIQGDYTMPEISIPKNTKYHLTVGTTGDVEPYSFYKDKSLVGCDIELVYRFGAWLGADITFQVYTWDSIIAAAQSGKIDVVASNLQVTPERSETIDFSDSIQTMQTGVMVRDTAATSDAASPKKAEYQTFSDLNGKTVSMLTGAPFENLISSKVQHVKEYTYFQTAPDMMLALKTGKTDAGFTNNAVGEMVANRDEELALFPESLGETSFGLGFAKGDAWRNEWQVAYNKIPQETKDALWKKWTGADDSIKNLPEQNWPGKNGTVRVAACDALEPMSYMGKDRQLLGLDIETILLIAKERDVHVEFIPMDFSAVLSALASKKADIICGSIMVTKERAESMDFLEYQPAKYVLIVRATTGLEKKTETAETTGFLNSITSSFEKTFVREDRYKLFLSGIGTTLLITVLSILFGTILGFVVFMVCRNGNKTANLVTHFFTWLISGLPVVVLLMILYYIIFAKSQITGTAVSVIAFTLVFGSGVFAMLKSGVGAIDKGQTETALSLGYGDIHSFFRIILPQAIPHFLPAYKGEIVSLIKATAVVGYIAVQDLTKMGDIVRGRTYEAFFPLIAVAVMYFVLAWILTLIVNRLEIFVNPKRRKREDILKGVNT